MTKNFRPNDSKFFSTRSPAVGTHGAVASSHSLASVVGMAVMKEAGGTAMDAAIAMNAMLTVVEPTGCGIGGDIFAMVSSQNQSLVGFNGNGAVPKGQTRDELEGRLRDRGFDFIPLVGAMSVSVPGCVDGWFQLHERYGVVPMSQLLAPAIQRARDGVALPEVIRTAWDGNLKSIRKFADDGVVEEVREFAQVFGSGASVDGDWAHAPLVYRNELLANSLQAIATGGRDEFYSGSMAKAMDQYCRTIDCPLRLADLVDHSGEWVDPVRVSYGDDDVFVYELPPPGQGLAALQMLRLVEQKRASDDFVRKLPHYLIEAKRLAFEDRARFFCDPRFHDVPVEWLLSQSYTAERAAQIQRDAAISAPGFGGRRHQSPPSRGDTVYLAASDCSMSVSLIQSNYCGLGSGLCPTGLGFCFQNRGSLLACGPGVPKDHPNLYAPGKRPFHTIIPAFMERGDDELTAFGVMGGDFQPQGHVQIVSNLIDLGMGLQEAGDAPRWRHVGGHTPAGRQTYDRELSDAEQRGTVHVEPGFDMDQFVELAKLGHTIDVVDGPSHPAYGSFGGYQAVRRRKINGDQFLFEAATESRKDGC